MNVMGVEEGYESGIGEKWAKHYSSNHQILLVGDGDFSFSLSLARSFGSASNIVATSLDPYDVVIKKYKDAESNLENLQKLGAILLHGVNATMMMYHTELKMRKFDRIIFNFPHAGFRGKEDNNLVIHHHRSLVHGFFWNARCMLRPNGEIHINHKTTAPFCFWDIVELASWSSLALIERIEFKIEDYPGYKHKRGDSSRCDEPFPLGQCSTFKFWLCPTANEMPRRKEQFQAQNPCNSFDFNRSQTGHITMFNDITNQPPQRLTSFDNVGGPNPNFEYVGFPPTDRGVRNQEVEFGSFFRSLEGNLIEMQGRSCHDTAAAPVHGMSFFDADAPLSYSKAMCVPLEFATIRQGISRHDTAAPPVHEMSFFNADMPLSYGKVMRVSPEFATTRQGRSHLDTAAPPVHEMSFFNADVPLSYGKVMHVSPEFGQRTCYIVGSHVNEFRYGGFNRNMIVNPERTLNQDMHVLPPRNERNLSGGGYSVNEPTFGCDRDMVSTHPRRNSNPELGLSKALSLVRKYGNQEDTFRNGLLCCRYTP